MNPERPDPSEHPCYTGEHAKFVKLHLPIGGRCNIHCRFCESGLEHEGQTADYPGRTLRTLTPDEIERLLRNARRECGRVDVVGIAGPGDPLANWKETRTALEITAETAPEAKRCLSTNGVWLERHLPELRRLIHSLTITVNTLNPDTAAHIYDRAVTEDGEVLTGSEAARWIVERQERALDLLADEPYLLKKVNFVLIPDVNEDDVEEVAKRAADAGLHAMNVIPLRPGGELKDHRPPTCRELSRARDRAERHLLVMRRCQQCRADVLHCHGRPRLIWDLLEEGD